MARIPILEKSAMMRETAWMQDLTQWVPRPQQKRNTDLRSSIISKYGDIIDILDLTQSLTEKKALKSEILMTE